MIMAHTRSSLATAVAESMERINTVTPLRASAAFFTFLRHNLSLPQSPSNSTVSTPLLDPCIPYVPSLKQPARSSSWSVDFTTTHAPDSTSATEEIHESRDLLPPEINCVRTRAEKHACLSLISESIIQQRLIAIKSLICSRKIILAYITTLVLLARLASKTPQNLGLYFSMIMAITLLAAVTLHLSTLRYLTLASRIDEAYILNPVTNEEDLLLVSSLHSSGLIIGTLILRLERHLPTSKKKGRKPGSGSIGGRGIIRAWTTRDEYRGKGVGRGLLEEAIRKTRERIGRDAGVGFAAEHANAGRVDFGREWLRWSQNIGLDLRFESWAWNAGVEKSERRAAAALDGVLGRKKKCSR